MSSWLHWDENYGLLLLIDRTYKDLWCRAAGVCLAYGGVELLFSPGAPTLCSQPCPAPLQESRSPRTHWGQCSCNFGSPCTYNSYLGENYFAFLATGFEVSLLHFHDINNSQLFISNAEPIYIYEKECVRKYQQIISRKSQDGFTSHYYHPVRSGGNWFV